MRPDANYLNPINLAEEIHQLTLAQLCRACGVDEDNVLVWVFEGVLEPEGKSPPEWRFGMESMRRVQQASRLSLDLGINPAGIALALDLLDEIAVLRVRLHLAKIR